MIASASSAGRSWFMACVVSASTTCWPAGRAAISGLSAAEERRIVPSGHALHPTGRAACPATGFPAGAAYPGRMAKVFDCIDESLARWLTSQPVWFVATAPLAGDGRINLSPRGHDCLSSLGPLQVTRADSTG